jgi:peptidoglycan-N-acetylglucosamine deacetylase
MDKLVKVTTSWDDGHTLDIKLSQLLYKYGLKGTFYISPKNHEFQKKDLLNEAEIIALSGSFEIGAHTLNHVALSGVDNNQARYEINESKRYLERLLSKEVRCFCYPRGDYRPIHVYIVKNAGYKLARTTKTFATNLSHSPFLSPTSVHAYDHWSDVLPVAKFSRFNPYKFGSYYRKWDVLAMAMFDRVIQTGGVFHLWGHSWEIEKFHDWKRLENVLEYVSARKNVTYVENGNLI